MPRLIVLTRNSSVRQVNIDGAVTTVGRAASNRVCIHSDRVSRYHATIQRSGDRYILIDMVSRNGTYVNDKKIFSHPLKNGDTITVGDCQLRFLLASETASMAEPLQLQPAIA
jgi:pSer/pThr/pTyr-binding forkhead associated (FHA) protein